MKFNPRDYDLRDIARSAFGMKLGRGDKTNCPFHDDKNPSMVIYKEAAHCFACEWHGGMLDFVMKKAGFSHAREAINFISGGVKKEPDQPKMKSISKKMKVYPQNLREAVWAYKDKQDKWHERKVNKIYPYISPETNSVVMAVVHFGWEENPDGSRGKKIMRPFSPIKGGGWISCNPTNGERLVPHETKPIHPSAVPMYNQHLFMRPAANGKLPAVLIVEGEKSADAANDWFEKNKQPIVATSQLDSYHYGLKSINPTQHVVVWPDKDLTGKRKAAETVKRLVDVGIDNIFVIQQLHEWPEKHDVADWLENNPTGDLLNFIRENRVRFDLNSQKQPLPPPKELNHEPHEKKLIHLGYSEGHLHLFSYNKAMLRSISNTPTSLANAAISLADWDYWREVGCINDQRNKLNLEQISTYLNMEAELVGPFNPNKVRAAGMWRDGETIVANTGGMLITEDGKRTSLHRQESFENLYVSTENPNPVTEEDEPLTMQEAERVQKMINLLPLDTVAMKSFFLGMLVQAIVGGIMRWRAHTWISGKAGAGKSWVMDNIVLRVLGRFAIQSGGAATTPAGVRTECNGKTFACVYDEADPGGEADVKKIEAVLAIIRMASDATDKTKPMSHGRPGGGGGEAGAATTAVKYRIRSPFIMASIGNPLQGEADVSRFVYMRLVQEKRLKNFHDYERSVKEFLTPNFPARFFLRCLSMAPLYGDALEVYSSAISDSLKREKRLGDTYGALLACRFVFLNGRAPTKEDALAEIEELDIDREIRTETKHDSEDVWDMVLQHEFYKATKEHGFETSTIGEIIFGKYSKDQSENRRAKTLLRNQYGITILLGGDKARVFGDNMKLTQKVFARTKYANSWFMVLCTHPLAKSSTATNPAIKTPKAFSGKATNTRKYVEIEIYSHPDEVGEDDSEADEEQ